MWDRRLAAAVIVAWTLATVCLPGVSRAQAPTIEQTGMVTGATSATRPGSMDSLLGPMPGAGAVSMGMQPGRDDMLLGRIGTSGPRVPTSISSPGGVYQGPPTGRGTTLPQAIPVPRAPLYGTLELPKEEDEGPADGLTLDQAIELLKQNNLDLRAKSYEIPQGRADVLTAGLRANPIFYADSQLVPYGSDSVKRPGGPTQYDVNISHPIDFSHKRRARLAYATRALEVMELQYQNEVRVALQNLYNAYVDVLAARETVRAIRESIKGLDEFVRVNQESYKLSNATRPDVDQAKADRETAVAGLMSAEGDVLLRKQTLAEILNLPPDRAERLELRGTIYDLAPPPPVLEELIQIAMASRPDVAAWQRGVAAAEANVKLQRANRFADAYLLFQPYTFQNNAPFGRESATSWAVGITLPLPVYNRNQGHILRAQFNVEQSQVQLSQQERRVVTEIQQALSEYQVSGKVARYLRTQVIPPQGRAREDQRRLFDEGEVTKFAYLDTRRRYNDAVKAYLDSAARHRRSMLSLNTVTGQRILP
jgi:cobalt-zinc-cadmium efflux system outer membrane protein